MYNNIWLNYGSHDLNLVAEFIDLLYTHYKVFLSEGGGVWCRPAVNWTLSARHRLSAERQGAHLLSTVKRTADAQTDTHVNTAQMHYTHNTYIRKHKQNYTYPTRFPFSTFNQQNHHCTFDNRIILLICSCSQEHTVCRSHGEFPRFILFGSFEAFPDTIWTNPDLCGNSLVRVLCKFTVFVVSWIFTD